MRRHLFLTVALCSVVSFLLGGLLSGGVTPIPAIPAAQPKPSPARPTLRPVSAAAAGAVNFADVAERINPSVVNIDAALRGGRVSRPQAMIGSLLDLKPILGLAGDDGRINALDRVRTRSRAIPRMLELMRADAPVESLAVMHAQAPDQAERIRAEVQRELPDLEVEIGQIGCVLGTHTGPRARSTGPGPVGG